jgi:16S rRNA C967 or C1407 C5-methylase (RsmB/RsmF family)
MSAAAATSPADLLPRQRVAQQDLRHPRTARVNTLKLGVQQAVKQLRAAPATAAVKVDPLLPDVLVLPAGTDMHDHSLVVDGSLVLQVGCTRHAVKHPAMHCAAAGLEGGGPTITRTA